MLGCADVAIVEAVDVVHGNLVMPDVSHIVCPSRKMCLLKNLCLLKVPKPLLSYTCPAMLLDSLLNFSFVLIYFCCA